MTFIIGILAGVLIAFQSAINARLRMHVGAAFLTSFVSFSVGLLFLLGLSLIMQQTPAFSLDNLDNVPLWAWTGGLLGMVGLTANVLIFPKLGGVQTAVMPILGQVLMGVLIDTFAWLNSPYIAFTASRLFGIGLVLFGVWIAVVLPHLSGLKRKENANLWLWRAVGILGGTALATQAAVNGELGRQLGSSLGAATVSFGVGAIGLLLVVLFYEKSLPKLCQPTEGKPFWIWSGGILGSLFILAGVWLVPQIGTGSVVMLVLSGLICGSLLVDKFGLFGITQKPILPLQIIGVTSLLAGVAFIRLL
ncbi:TPA: DMT family transporter [Mannheimia haemolytica]|nr:DMT family transporter [Mannheimia haemolytica]